MAGSPHNEDTMPVPGPSHQRLPPLNIPQHLRSNAGPSSAAPRLATSSTSGPPATPSSPITVQAGPIASASPRRRAHSVSVSFRPRAVEVMADDGIATAGSPSESRRRPFFGRLGSSERRRRDEESSIGLEPLGEGRGADDAPHEEESQRRPIGSATSGPVNQIRAEAAAESQEGGHTEGRSRASSIVDRFRGSIGSAAGRTRARAASNASGNGPVGFEVRRSTDKARGSVDVNEDLEQGVDGASVRRESAASAGRREELGDDVVGILDCVDQEVSTVNTLQNMTNGIFIPHFPALWSRRPEIYLDGDSASQTAPRAGTVPDHAPRRPGVTPPDAMNRLSTDTGRASVGRKRATTIAALYPSVPPPLHATPTPPSRGATVAGGESEAAEGQTAAHGSPTDNEDDEDDVLPKPPLHTRTSATSAHSLDLHVRRALHDSKRQKLAKAFKGIWVFIKTPLGFCTLVYGVLVVFWGAGLVMILAGWIPMPDQWWRDRWVEISSQILNGLFTITGVGLIPWRVVDTYRMVIIYKLKRKVHRLRNAQGLPPIDDPNDIPDPKDQKDYVSVLSEFEQAQLLDQQDKFAKSQTWYRPHATATHRAFPISWALWNTILMDGNSFFQCLLCGCMWGLNQYQRPAWTTGSLIPLSFLCGIAAAVLIWQGGVRTKKISTVEDKLRAALGVQLAVALPKSKDGTIITGNNRALINEKRSTGGSDNTVREGERPGTAADVTGKGDSEEGPQYDEDTPLHKVVSPINNRRATVTIGNVLDEPPAPAADSRGGVHNDDGPPKTRRNTSPQRRTTIGHPDEARGDHIGRKSELDLIRTGETHVARP